MEPEPVEEDHDPDFDAPKASTTSEDTDWNTLKAYGVSETTVTKLKAFATKVGSFDTKAMIDLIARYGAEVLVDMLKMFKA